MGKLQYTAIASLDGYIADENGNFEWSAPDEEVHSFVNDMQRNIGTYLLGRRMYEVLAVWDTLLDDPRLSPAEREYAELWSGIDKVVCSRTLQEVSTSRTRIEREFDVDAVRRLKEESELDIGIDGPELAAQAMAAGLVDECHVLFSPVVLGGGKKAFPDGTRLRLELLDRRRFGNGVAYLHYGVLHPE